MLSAYCINEVGLLVYSGLPTSAQDLKYKHFNGVKYSPNLSLNIQYEVVSICTHGLCHGKVCAEKLGLRYLLIQNCYRVV